MSIIPGEELLIKIWETLEKGVTGLIRPWQEKRVGQALNEVKAAEIRKIADAEKDAEKIKTGKFFINPQGKIISFPQQPKALPKDSQTPTSTVESSIQNESANPNTIELLKTAELRDQYLKLRREINLRKIAIHAFDEAQNQDDNEVADEPVDPGWFYQWQEKAQNIQHEDLQKLWAKTLAGEVKKPGSYSLFTLDFLYKLTKHDAETISKIARYRLEELNDHYIFYPTQEFFIKKGLTLATILELESLGLISFVGGNLLHTWSTKEKEELRGIISYLNKAIFLINEKKLKFDIKQICLTNIGKEIMSLGSFEIDQDYLNLLINELKNHGCKVYEAEHLEKLDSGWKANKGREL